MLSSGRLLVSGFLALLLVAPPFGIRAESGGTAHGEHAKPDWVKQVTVENVGVAKLVPLPTEGWLGVGSAPSGRSSGDVDGWIMRLDEAGDITWQRAIGGPFNDMFVDVAPTVDGGWLLAGLTQSFGLHGTVCYGWLCKLDSQLAVSWQRRYRDTSIQGLQFVTSILAAENGTSIALITPGSCRSSAFTLVSLGPAGAVRWSKSYDFNKSIANLAYDPIRLRDGTIVIAGTTQELTSSQTSLRRWEPFLLKIDTSGEPVWTKRVVPEGGATSGGTIEVSTPTAKGGVALAGGVADPATSWDSLGWLMTVDSNGTLQMEKRYSSYWLTFTALKETRDGSFLLGTGASDLLRLQLAKTSADGTIKWGVDYPQIEAAPEGFQIGQDGRILCWAGTDPLFLSTPANGMLPGPCHPVVNLYSQGSGSSTISDVVVTVTNAQVKYYRMPAKTSYPDLKTVPFTCE